MLKKTRIVLAAIFFVCTTLLFLDFTGTLHKWLGWMAKIQFLPAVLAVNTLVVAGLLLLTILFGRIYCSVICPLGVMQDIISWINGRLKKKNRFRFRHEKEKKWLRITVLVLFIIAMAAGAHSAAILIAPYSAYGRIASNLLAPIYLWGNNLFAWFAERADSYAFYEKEVWIRSLPTFITATVTFVILFIMAWKGGRKYCNTICPVGTILGFFSKRSIFVPVIDSEKCRGCGLCGRKCKSSCIDMKNHEIDYSRCVACMDCIETCSEGAISYKCRYGNNSESSAPDNGRRAFMVSAGILATAAAANAGKRKGLPDRVMEKTERQTPPVPAGSVSLKNFTDHCTACQLCVGVCPENVLQPSSSLSTLMQPEMRYEKGFCRPECNRCSEVCPAGAIKPITIEEKSSVQVGHAVVNHERCVIKTDGVSCANCARRCPVGAIRLVRDKNDRSILLPVVNEEMCIGCGACEYLCPARPVKAIHVEGHLTHKTI